NHPVFVEVGTSTYESNDRRQIERSTFSHNTVVVREKNQSEVYGGFRVGKRAKAFILSDNGNTLIAEHDGYVSSFNVFHKRSFTFNNSSITIIDNLSINISSKAYFHLHPSLEFEIHEGYFFIKDVGSIRFDGFKHIQVLSYDFADGFNNTIPGKKLCVEF